MCIRVLRFKTFTVSLVPMNTTLDELDEAIKTILKADRESIENIDNELVRKHAILLRGRQ